MTTWQILILVGCVLVMDTVIVGAVLAATGAQWKRFATYFPERPVLAGAQRRTWQTVRLGVWNWGWSFTISVDAQCVHLTPGPRIGKLMGGCTASIPVEALGQTETGAGGAAKPRRRSGRIKLKLAGRSIELPSWVMPGV